MPQPLKDKELQFFKAILGHTGSANSFRFGPLRKAGLPEKTEEIFQSGSEWLDSQVSRKLQILRDKGWITMDDGLYTIVNRPNEPN